MMRRWLRILFVVLLVPLVAGGGFFLWAVFQSGRKLSRTIPSHWVDFPIPFPLSDEEVRQSILAPDSAATLAQARAIERGRHLLESRYGCDGCHGKDFGGGVMIDDRLIGRAFGPNLTTGTGGRTATFSPADWDRIVRHGIRHDGTAAVMPAQDFQRMSDQELSDIIVYIRSLPPRDNPVAPVRFGPLGRVLVATGALKLAPDQIPAHDAPHPGSPPEATATAEFGRHLAGTCSGCHRADLAGGPIVGGDPGWGPAANLTPHESGLAGWTYDQFVVALREGKRPDGTVLKEPMTFVASLAQKMSEVELRAIWAYLQSLPPLPSRN